MLKSTITALSLLAAPLPVTAAEPGGKAWGSIGGEEIEIPVWTEQSDSYASGFSIYFRAPALRELGFANLSLGAEWLGELKDNFFSAEIDISILNSDPRRIYRADLDDGLFLTITNFAHEDGMTEITGRVEATLHSMDMMALRNPDPSDTLDVNLMFDAIVRDYR